LVRALTTGWQYLGASTFKSQSETFYSGGGNLLIYLTQPYAGPGFDWWYKLAEEDPMFDDEVSRFQNANQPGVYELIFDVRSFVDVCCSIKVVMQP